MTGVTVMKLEWGIMSGARILHDTSRVTALKHSSWRKKIVYLRTYLLLLPHASYDRKIG